eukprot:Clim_evm1s150 gene=Clim_evmTU1s150
MSSEHQNLEDIPKVVIPDTKDNKKESEAYSPKTPGAWSQKTIDGLPVSAIFILVVEFCERLTFYGASLCFFLYMTDMLGWDTSTANAAYNGFTFWCYFTSLIGAYIADAHLGRYKTILYFACVYMVGVVLLTLGATGLGYGDFSNPPGTKNAFATWSFIASLFLIGLGTGGIKSNVSPMVADQLHNISAADVEKVFKFFYWAINAGAFIGILVSPVLHHFGTKFQGPDMDAAEGTSYWMAYLFPTIVFFVGFFIYVIGRRYYSVVKPTGSLLSRMLGLTWHAAKERKHHKRTGVPPKRVEEEGDYENVKGFLDYAFPAYTKQDIADLRQTLHACKVMTVFPIFWVLYNQMSTNFIEQGTMMQRPSWLTADQLNLVDPLVIMIFIPFCQYWFYPWIRSFGYKLGCISRISIGFAIIASAFVYAGILQIIINKSEPNSVSIWLQIPAYGLIGMGEIFSSTTGLEYAYAVAPGSMKSLCMSFFLLTTAIASLIGLIIAPVMVPDNYVIIFFVFSGVMGVLAPLYYWVFKNCDVEVIEQGEYETDSEHTINYEVDVDVPNLR